MTRRLSAVRRTRYGVILSSMRDSVRESFPSRADGRGGGGGVGRGGAFVSSGALEDANARRACLVDSKREYMGSVL